MYGDDDQSRIISYEGGAMFIPRCPKCGRYVKADESVFVSDAGLRKAPNGTCKRDGRVEMYFIGFM